jgi:flagellar biosynthesis GTPase FlhF
MVEGQEEGHEEEWQLANVRNFPYLRYRNVSLNGTPAPPPQRTQVDTSRLGPSMLLLQQAREFIHQGTGAFESALGQQSPNAKSGRAILALQNQHETGSSHFLDNLAEISLTYEAKVILDLIPHIYDRPGRIARILDKEDEPKTVMLNAPFTMNPQTKRPQPAPMPGIPMPGQMPGQMPAMPGQMPGMPGMPGMLGPKKPAENYDLRKGRYGVTVSIGKSYKSRREQGADEMGNLFQANPALFPILGDIYLKFRDFPGHLEASERVKKMLPPPLQAQDAGPDPQQLQQQLQQAGQMVEQLTKALDEKTKLLDMDAQKLQMQAQQAQGEQQVKVDIERMRNETQLAITAMKIRADEAGAIFQAEVMRVGTGMSQQFDATQQAAQQHHLQQMAAQQALQAQTQSEQDYMQGQQMSEQQARQAQEASAQDAQQDAALVPPDGDVLADPSVPPETL